MKYHYNDRFKEHWGDVTKMVEENYSQDYDDNDCLILSAHLINDIYTGVEMMPDCNKKIVYQLEPLVENHWVETTEIIKCLQDYDEVWDYDLSNIEVLKQNGINAKFKPFIYSENLKRIENKEEPDIDVLFYGTLTGYRARTLARLLGNSLDWGIKLVTINNVTGKLLDDFISRSKIILDLSTDGNLQQRIQKQSRIFYALINNKCVISEKSDTNYFKDLITEVDIDENYNRYPDGIPGMYSCDDISSIIMDYIYNNKWKEYSNVSERFKKLNNKY
jgi:hypothetical protein